MRPELNFTNEEKVIIRDWKQSLDPKENRIFSYMFVGTGKRNGEGFCLYNFVIATNDGQKMTLVRNITL